MILCASRMQLKSWCSYNEFPCKYKDKKGLDSDLLEGCSLGICHDISGTDGYSMNASNAAFDCTTYLQ